MTELALFYSEAFGFGLCLGAIADFVGAAYRALQWFAPTRKEPVL